MLMHYKQTGEIITPASKVKVCKCVICVHILTHVAYTFLNYFIVVYQNFFFVSIENQKIFLPIYHF